MRIIDAFLCSSHDISFKQKIKDIINCFFMLIRQIKSETLICINISAFMGAPINPKAPDYFTFPLGWHLGILKQDGLILFTCKIFSTEHIKGSE